MAKQFKGTTSFASKFRTIPNKEKSDFLALAALEELRGVIPKSVESQASLLPIVGNAFVVNLANLNGDMIDTKTALSSYKSFIDTQINLNHKRSDICGHVISAGLSKFNTDYALGAGSEPLKEEDVKDSVKPFNVSLAGVVYKVYSQELTNLLQESANPNSDKYMEVSFSWEVSFDAFSLAVGSIELEKCDIIEDEEEITKLEKYLIGNGGSGRLPDGRIVSRLIQGNIVPLGLGLTESPAGLLKGIITGENKNAAQKESNSAQNEQVEEESDEKELTIEEKLAEISRCLKNIDKSFNFSDKDLECVAKFIFEGGVPYTLDKNKTKDERLLHISRCIDNTDIYKRPFSDDELLTFAKHVIGIYYKPKQDLVNTLTEIAASKEKISQNTNINVKESKTMNINKVEDITQEALKEITASQIQDFIQKKCAEISENWVNEKKAKDEELKAFTESKKALDETVTSLNTKLAEVTKSLETIQAEAAEKAKIETYNQRMAHIESIYELDPEITKIVASDLKDIDEDGFKKIEEKYKVLFKDKNKAEIEAAKKKKMEKEKEDSKEDSKEDKKEDKKEGEDKKLPPWLDKKKAKASVEDAVNNSEKEKVNVPNTTSTETPTLAERAKKAFAKENVKIDCSRRRKI